MNNLLQHPNIWIFNALLLIPNFFTFCVCIAYSNVTGIALNAFFLVFNATAAANGFMLRGYRRRLQVQHRLQRRQRLIEETIGR